MGLFVASILGFSANEENPTCGDTPIQGALKNVGHRIGRSTTRRS
jgi:hypothetical protein